MGSNGRERLSATSTDAPAASGTRKSRRRSRPADPTKQWVRSLLDALLETDAPPHAIIAAAQAVGAAELGLRSQIEPPVSSDGVTVVGEHIRAHAPPPNGWADPWLPGLLHELSAPGAARKSRGAWYTPRALVEGLVRFVHEVADAPDFVLDPTCGGGAFLLAALDHKVASGIQPELALEQVAGADIDSGAAQVTRWALELWAAGHGIENTAAKIDVVVTDALHSDLTARWPSRRLVLGNPPFASPLKTGAFPSTAVRYREEHAEDLGQYADLAVVHLHRCVETSAPGSVVALVLPQSVVSSRDVAPYRHRLSSFTSTVGMWAAREAVFDAGIRTCAPVVVVEPAENKAPGNRHVALASGPDVQPAGLSSAAGWSAYAARCLGAPTLPDAVWSTSSTLADLCQATAGFRDEFYGLVAACREWDQVGQPPNRLLTVGCVDPLTTTWGSRPVRFGGNKWTAPVIDPSALEGKVLRWWERQAKPKLVVATQSKILEPVVDTTGDLVPSTPLLAVHADPEDLPWIAAVLLAPPVVAVAWERWFGAALAVDALKLAARQIAELPLPADRAMWERAAGVIAAAVETRALLEPEEAQGLAAEVAAIMNEAYGGDASVLDWWSHRAGQNRSAAVGSGR